MKKCGLYVLLSAVSLIVSFTVFSDSAAAASDYDDTIGEANKTIHSPNGSQSFTFNNLNEILKGVNGVDTCVSDNDFMTVVQHYYSTNTPIGRYQRINIMTYGRDNQNRLPQFSFFTNGSTKYLGLEHEHADYDFDYAKKWVTIGLDNNGQLFSQCYDVQETSYIHPTATDFGAVAFGAPNYRVVPIYMSSEIRVKLPDGYNGAIINDNTPPEVLEPEYQWSVTGEGILNVRYLKNINPFLTGTSFISIESMTDNWESVINQLESITSQPAGWLDESYQLPAAGYYMLRIDHDQQLDSPPWKENHNYQVKQIWFQFYWNGKNAISGDNIGGCEGICNDMKGEHRNKILRALAKINMDDRGLESLILAPLNVLASLPGYANNCTPITVPFLNDKNITMQCIRGSLTQAMPNIMQMFIIITNGAITLFVAYKTFNLIKRLSDPEDDKIEVHKL